MLIDGEKWACEACVRGHRVSSCKHHDRPLTHINRKGRPFSTCPTCHCTPCSSPYEHIKLRRDGKSRSQSLSQTEDQAPNAALGRHDSGHGHGHGRSRSRSALIPIAPRPGPSPSSSSSAQSTPRVSDSTGTRVAPSGLSASATVPPRVRATEAAAAVAPAPAPADPRALQYHPPASPLGSDPSLSAAQYGYVQYTSFPSTALYSSVPGPDMPGTGTGAYGNPNHYGSSASFLDLDMNGPDAFPSLDGFELGDLDLVAEPSAENWGWFPGQNEGFG
ncbi:copper fist DNA binding domain-containing protein [Aspergillus unguis]